VEAANSEDDVVPSLFPLDHLISISVPSPATVPTIYRCLPGELDSIPINYKLAVKDSNVIGNSSVLLCCKPHLLRVVGTPRLAAITACWQSIDLTAANFHDLIEKWHFKKDLHYILQVDGSLPVSQFHVCTL
jgi:hypothetical protein